MTQHAAMDPERWLAFPLSQQILMIGNEMNRAGKLMGASDRERRLGSYERVLRLTDLTIEVRPARGLRRELLRWRDLIAHLYDAGEPNPAVHTAAFRCLLRFTPESSRQIPFLGLEPRSAD